MFFKPNVRKASQFFKGSVSNSVFEPGDLYTELAQNKADIVFAAR